MTTTDPSPWAALDRQVRGIRQSRVVISVVPTEPDAQICSQLGAAILYDKPIIAVALPGRPVPATLRRIAEAVVECDPRTEEGQKRLMAALAERGLAGPSTST